MLPKEPSGFIVSVLCGILAAILKLIFSITVTVFLIYHLLVFTGVFTWESWNYRVTVEVETPEGIKTGSAVRQLQVWSNYALNPDVGSYQYKVLGEAVVIDLGERGALFGLIGASSYEFLTAFFGRGGNGEKEIYEASKFKIGRKVEVDEYFLRMYAFEDIDIPSSVKLVKGYKLNSETKKTEPADNFEMLFGKGIRLHRITLEVTNDPVTRRIGNILPWLPEYYDRRLDGNRTRTIKAKNRVANSLSSGVFSTGR